MVNRTVLCFAALFLCVVTDNVPYKLKIKRMAVCKKESLNAPIVQIDSLIEHANGSQDYVMKFNVSREIGPISVHNKVSKTENGKTRIVLTLKYTNVCKHFITRLLVKQSTWLSQNCFSVKGQHVAKVNDADYLTHVMLGKKLEPGEYKVRFIELADNRPFHCMNIIFDIIELASNSPK